MSFRRGWQLHMLLFFVVLLFVFGLWVTLSWMDILDSCKTGMNVANINKVYYQSSLNQQKCDEQILKRTQELTEEISSLKDQVISLQDVISSMRNELRRPATYDSKYREQLSKTEIERGIVYKSEYQNMAFIRFTLWHQYPYGTGRLVDKFSGNKRIHIDAVIDTAVAYLQNITHNVMMWRRDHFTEGLYRYTEALGTHYDLKFVNDHFNQSRVALFQPEVSPIAVKTMDVNNDRPLNIIITLTKSKKDSFQRFLTNFVQNILKRPRTSLTIVYYGESLKDLMKVFQPFLLHNVQLRSVYRLELVNNQNYSRGYALDAGVKSWKGRADPLMFFCDVDMIFNLEFLERCTSYTEQARSVYYPIVFSLYNPTVVEKFSKLKFPNWKDQLKVDPEYGFWREFGYGMACMYKSDYEQVGRFDLDIEGWGEEDVKLFRKFSQSNLTTYRAADPDIYHIWHEKTCSTSLSSEKYKECIRTKAINEGSQLELASLLFG